MKVAENFVRPLTGAIFVQNCVGVKPAKFDYFSRKPDICKFDLVKKKKLSAFFPFFIGREVA